MRYRLFEVKEERVHKYKDPWWNKTRMMSCDAAQALYTKLSPFLICEGHGRFYDRPFVWAPVGSRMRDTLSLPYNVRPTFNQFLDHYDIEVV